MEAKRNLKLHASETALHRAPRRADAFERRDFAILRERESGMRLFKDTDAVKPTTGKKPLEVEREDAKKRVKLYRERRKFDDVTKVEMVSYILTVLAAIANLSHATNAVMAAVNYVLPIAAPYVAGVLTFLAIPAIGWTLFGASLLLFIWRIGRVIAKRVYQNRIRIIDQAQSEQKQLPI